MRYAINLLMHFFVGYTAGVVILSLPSSTPPKKDACECRCDCYWRGKEDGRNEVRKANAELLKKQSHVQEWPEGTEKPWWADRPAVN